MKHATASTCTGRAFSAAELDAELGRVHARRFARLLLGAARLRACAARSRGDELAGWRRAAQEARRLAAVDGYEPPGLLRQCLGRDLERWAGLVDLVRAAALCSPAEVRLWELRRAVLSDPLAKLLAQTDPSGVAPW